MMARVAGIPSRVAIGFLPGEQVGDSWEVSVKDMHAWPELYFSSWGWVRFEPTPSVQTGEAPPWTVQPEEAPTDDPSAEPSASVSAGPSATTDPRDNTAETPVTADETDWGRLAAHPAVVRGRPGAVADPGRPGDHPGPPT